MKLTFKEPIMTSLTEDLESAEAEANYFAMCLLMPEDFVRIELRKFGHFDMANDKHVKFMADKFRVPVGLMVLRIGQLMDVDLKKV